MEFFEIQKLFEYFGMNGLRFVSELLEDILNIGIVFCAGCFSQKIFPLKSHKYYGSSDVVYYGSGEWGDSKFWTLLEQGFSALVSGLLERL